MIRQPPRSTLFPYTTLFRSSLWPSPPRTFPHLILFRFAGRSEEHTSELQSRFDLVCRLLLEKKKRTSHPASPPRIRVLRPTRDPTAALLPAPPLRYRFCLPN